MKGAEKNTRLRIRRGYMAFPITSHCIALLQIAACGAQSSAMLDLAPEDDNYRAYSVLYAYLLFIEFDVRSRSLKPEVRSRIRLWCGNVLACGDSLSLATPEVRDKSRNEKQWESKPIKVDF